MAKYEVLIEAVTIQGLSHGQVANRYGVSKTLVHKLHHRWLGEDAYQPRSRRPRTNPNATPEAVRERVLTLRDDLLARGLDAGADTLSWHLAREQITCSRATIRRILKAAGKPAAQPQKAPPLLLATLRRRPARRVVAIRFHPRPTR